MAALVLIAMPFSSSILAQGRGASPANVPDGTPVPRTGDGRADLSGVWNKRLVQNTAAAAEPLPFTPEGLKAFNDVWNHIDPTSKCMLPGVPRVNTSPYPMQIVQLPDKVVFLYQYMHNFRVIYTDGRTHRRHGNPRCSAIRSADGTATRWSSTR